MEGINEGDQDGRKYTFVCTKDKIMQERKMRCNVDGRELAMFYHDGEIFVLDHSCYREYIQVQLVKKYHVQCLIYV